MAAVWLSLAGAGCVTPPVDPDPMPGVGAPEEGGKSREIPNFSGGAWWESFRDRRLNALMREALADNPDLRSVGQRIDQANLLVTRAGASLFPNIDGQGGFQRRWDVEGRRGDDASLGLLLDWELDVWGRIRAGRSARVREAEAAEEDWLAARLLLSAAVAELWFELCEQRGQANLVGEQIEVNRTLLNLTRLRFGQGQSSVVAVYQQQEQLESTEALMPDIVSRIDELELSLDALLGRLPGNDDGSREVPELGDPPSREATGVASDLLARRPDLRAQRARLVALDHEVGEAMADRWPRFTIGASLGAGGSPTLERLVGDAVLGAVAPVFDAGDRKAEIGRRQSRVREELDRYTSLYLEAARDVEVALVRERQLAERVRLQERQLGTARKLLAESRNRYSQGATDYLPVLDAVSKVQELERDLLTSRRERLSARVGLHRAIGGPMPETEWNGVDAGDTLP